ncbi:DUF5908 family protein [Ekhidna sp.]|uniref:DUF5908 family protein n=1 Tax=Ekhidna sp. TaxID=2608089 RepID=UPI00329A626C
MPVEIKELIIRTNIVSETGLKDRSPEGVISKKQMRNIVDDCVNQVMKAIERKDER